MTQVKTTAKPHAENLPQNTHPLTIYEALSAPGEYLLKERNQHGKLSVRAKAFTAVKGSNSYKS